MSSLCFYVLILFNQKLQMQFKQHLNEQNIQDVIAVSFLRGSNGPLSSDVTRQTLRGMLTANARFYRPH